MVSPWKKQPEDVVDCVLKRAEVSKIARNLQNRLALAQFKAKHGWEELTLDSIEPKVEEEIRRRRAIEADNSDSSSSVSDLPYPTKALMSSPSKRRFFPTPSVQATEALDTASGHTTCLRSITSSRRSHLARASAIESRQQLIDHLRTTPPPGRTVISLRNPPPSSPAGNSTLPPQLALTFPSFRISTPPLCLCI
uniref:Uncharacterized protein n=1 Tax=Bionectria ochroleuca TaxID=29856 RepID=A0A8H7TTR2_BIOOC